MAKIDEHIKVMMLKGETGANIKSIDKTATSGLVDTYTVTLTDGTKSNFNVTNGRDGKDGADFDIFEIGGRNLIRDSAKLGPLPHYDDLYAGSYGSSAIKDRGDGFKAAYAYKSYQGICVYANGFGLNAGDKITFSAVFEPHGKDLAPRYSAYCRNASGSTVSTGLKSSAVFGAVKDGESKRVSVTIEWTEAAKSLIDSGGSVMLVMLTWSDLAADSGNYAYFYAPKLERSTKPSDWTPAPEDKADVSALAGKADVSAIVPKASVESSSTASQAYAAGQYVVVNGILRRVTAAIAKGNAISDSNSTATTVVGELWGLAKTVSEADTWHALYETESWSVYYTKRFEVLYIRIHVGGLTTDWWKAGTLPEAYRPKMDVYTPMYNYKENNCAVAFVGKNGEVSMQSYQSSSSAISWAIITVPLW